jgi:hypothetical protein
MKVHIENFEPVWEGGKPYHFEKVGPAYLKVSPKFNNKEKYIAKATEGHFTLYVHDFPYKGKTGAYRLVPPKFKLGDELFRGEERAKVYTVIGIEVIERQTPEEVGTILSLTETKTIWRDKWHFKYQLEEKK